MNKGILKVVDAVYYVTHPSLWGRKNYNEFIKACNTTTACGGVKTFGFQYKKDKKDKWQTPLETWNRRNILGQLIGDCEDLARLFVHCLEDSYLVVVYSKKGAHAFCAQGTETVGTFGRIEHNTNDFGKMASYWYKEWYRVDVYVQHPFDYKLEIFRKIRR